MKCFYETHKELLQEVINNYPTLLREIKSLKQYETEIKRKIAMIMFGKSDELLTTMETARIEGISEATVRNKIEDYEYRLINDKQRMIRLYSTKRIEKSLNMLKQKVELYV